jgi:hypothetical protein
MNFLPVPFSWIRNSGRGGKEKNTKADSSGLEQ